MTLSGVFFGVLYLFLTISFSLFVIYRKRDPLVTLAWILTFFLTGSIGCLIYLFFGYQRRFRRRWKKAFPLRARHADMTIASAVNKSDIKDVEDVVSLVKKLTEFEVTVGNAVQILDESHETYSALIESMRQARHHIHFLYYIFQPDKTGILFRDLLIQKAKEGVRCRLLFDALGSWRLKKSFIQPMLDAGVSIDFFGSVRFVMKRLGLDTRNHRKIVVVDGCVGFIGSQNIGDEYRHWRHRKLAWRDTHLRLEGPVVNQLQAIFVEDWYYTTGEDISGQSYFPVLPSLGKDVVQTLPTGPDEEEKTLDMIFLALLHEAKTRVTITTPYFVPHRIMLLALESASLRGVMVEILVPKKSDQWLLDQTKTSWYAGLLAEGIHIYEEPDIFVHAKVITIDDKIAMVGSANMDIRSFSMNFEAGVLIYSHDVVRKLIHAFDASKARSKRITDADLPPATVWHQLKEGFFRLISPLL